MSEGHGYPLLQILKKTEPQPVHLISRRKPKIGNKTKTGNNNIF
jgi:hypothetical protein